MMAWRGRCIFQREKCTYLSPTSLDLKTNDDACTCPQHLLSPTSPPPYAHYNTKRVATKVIAEEVTSTISMSIGAGIGAWFGGLAAIPGAIIGGVLGDWAGGASAVVIYAKSRQLNNEKLLEIVNNLE